MIFFRIPLRSEEPYFDGTFIAKDADVHQFVEEIRSKMKSVSKIYSVCTFDFNPKCELSGFYFIK